MTTWTAHDDDQLAALIGEGFSGSQAGTQMKRSRNSCVGRAHRLGLTFKGPHGGWNRTGKTPAKPAKLRLVKPAKPLHPSKLIADRLASKAAEPPAPKLVGPRMVPLVDLTAEDCKWPIGDPRDPSFGFCGHPRIPGCPYCPDHRHLS